MKDARPHFTRRTAWDLAENPLTRAVAGARAAGRPLVDLTEGNPTRVGLAPTEGLLATLGDARGALYEPSALGHPVARAAVARYYEERGLAVSPERVAITASTSEAYGWLLKLLVERGERVLVPAPSYPLLGFLAALEDVELDPYPLVREEGWRIDLAALEEAASSREARAIVLVHPNNPTGSFVRRDEAARLDELAARGNLALIVDEVFGDYAHGPLPLDRLPSFVGPRQALTFVLSGLSKVALLPQLKLGWIAVLGPEDTAAEAVRRLEVIADTYLSAGTPVQLALPELLAGRGRLQAAVLARVLENLRALDAAVARSEAGVRRLPLDGGWYALLEIPRTRDEDAWIHRLLEEDGLVVHPGYFFDLAEEGFLVLSLLPEPDAFAGAATRLLARLGEG